MAQVDRSDNAAAIRGRLVRRLAVLAVSLVTALGVAAVAAPAAFAGNTPDSYAARMGQLINQTRVAHGLQPVTVTSGTSRVARGWALHLAQQQSLSHNPQLAQQIEANGSPNWTVVAENVGSGYVEDPDAVFAAYMNSPGHRRNILDARMRFVGLAAVFTGNTAWDVMNFVDSYGTPAPVASPAPAKPAAAPVRTAAAPVQAVAARPVPQQVAAPVKPAKTANKPAAQRLAPKAKPRLTAPRSAPAASPRVADASATRPAVAPTALFEQPLMAFSVPAPAQPASPLPLLAVGLAAGMLIVVTGGMTAAVARRK